MCTLVCAWRVYRYGMRYLVSCSPWCFFLGFGLLVFGGAALWHSFFVPFFSRSDGDGTFCLLRLLSGICPQDLWRPPSNSIAHAPLKNENPLLAMPCHASYFSSPCPKKKFTPYFAALKKKETHTPIVVFLQVAVTIPSISRLMRFPRNSQLSLSRQQPTANIDQLVSEDFSIHSNYTIQDTLHYSTLENLQQHQHQHSHSRTHAKGTIGTIDTIDTLRLTTQLRRTPSVLPANRQPSTVNLQSPPGLSSCTPHPPPLLPTLSLSLSLRYATTPPAVPVRLI